MQIPSKVKIGGLDYTVEISEFLRGGSVNYSAEVRYEELKIVIRPQVEQKMLADFFHELMHCIYNHLGYSEHDEKQIDELSNALLMVFRDNPGIIGGDTDGEGEI